jgi:peroxiredoxin Q/BCP
MASVDDPKKNKEFAESLAVDFPILSDPGKKVAKAWGVLMPVVGLPKRWTFYVGADGRILHVDKDVKPNTAGDDIAKKLAELGVPKAK